ncbi:hypothetical protein INR49_029711 [Caranx melampygus]|nr:hypothetical protein INR49_029711 [Caranx melampygus]
MFFKLNGVLIVADKGSFVVRMCTKETDTECKCREGFAPWGDDTSTCKCEPGFGLTDAQCSECENGYFNPNVNKPCRKWTECEYGVKINGTTTSDVICNPDITTPNTACSTSNCRQEGIQTQNRDTTTTTTISSSSSSSTTTTTTTTATPLGHTLTTKRLQPPMPSNTSNYTGLVLLLFGIGALIILTAVTCKMHITPCVRNPSLPSKDSMCRRPVEEIGDGSLSSLKLNTEP